MRGSGGGSDCAHSKSQPAPRVVCWGPTHCPAVPGRQVRLQGDDGPLVSVEIGLRPLAIDLPEAHPLTMNVRDLLRLLAADGWYLARTRGSHQQFKHPVKSGLVTVAGKPGDVLAPGTLNSILKQAGLKR